jgi:thioredoxin-like negative regulator of GroEL
MTNEKRAALLQTLLELFLVGGVVAGAFFYRQSQAVKAPPAAAVTVEKEPLELIHYHIPGDANSEQLAAVLTLVQTKYGKKVKASRVDAKLHPDLAKTQRVTRFPHVIINSNKAKVFEFQGVWAEARLEKKIDELLIGLQRVDRNWRPAVQGMERAGG